MGERTVVTETKEEQERVVLVGVVKNNEQEWLVKESVAELGRLAETAGGKILDVCVVHQKIINPGHYIGSGKAEQIAETVAELEANTVIFDDELSPAQGRNLENIIEVKVIDRTQLILDIFALHANTRDGRLQVELARLNYLLPRLRRMWTHLERQQGGIGVRGGPGEQQIEMDRRMLQEKMHRIRRDLKDVRRHRDELRRGRQRHGWASISLVGYTNAGKSSLLNALSGSSIEAKDALFVTLDTTTRKVQLPNHQPALLSDTVGFISKLPHKLIEAFRATLEEVIQADVLIHVVDSSSNQVDEQIDAVNRVLQELGIEDKPTIMALNKIDLPQGQSNARRLERMYDHVAAVSAHSGEGLDELLDVMADQLRGRFQELYMTIPAEEYKHLAFLKANARILAETLVDTTFVVVAAVPARLVHRCDGYVVEREAYDALLAEERASRACADD